MSQNELSEEAGDGGKGLGKNVPGRGDSMYKGHEAGRNLTVKELKGEWLMFREGTCPQMGLEVIPR